MTVEKRKILKRKYKKIIIGNKNVHKRIINKRIRYIATISN